MHPATYSLASVHHHDLTLDVYQDRLVLHEQRAPLSRTFVYF